MESAFLADPPYEWFPGQRAEVVVAEGLRVFGRYSEGLIEKSFPMGGHRGRVFYQEGDVYLEVELR